MKRIILIGLLAINLSLFAQELKESGSLVMEGIPEVPSAIIDRMNQYQNVRAASVNSWHPDGKQMLISTRFSETAQLHMIDHPGGARKQITFFKEPVGGGSFCPDRNYNGFIFSKDTGGNEFAQLYWYDMVTGAYEMISDGSRSQNRLSAWSNKGDQFVMVSTRRNSKDYDLYLVNMKNPKEAKIILQRGGSWSAQDFSPDDKKLLVQNYVSANKSFLHILDMVSGNLEPVNASSEDIAYGGGFWSADGKGIFLVSDQGGEFRTLKYYDIAAKKSVSLTSSIPWDVDGMVINTDRSTLAFVTNENGISKLYQLDTSSKKFKAVSSMPTGVIGTMKFNPKGDELALVINTSQTPSDVFTLNLKNEALTQWTFSEVGGLNTQNFVTPTLIEYETFDQVNNQPRRIPAFYSKPKTPTGKLPVVINIHGGPEGQSLPTFSPFINYLVNELGVAVISPNVRGSSGYGKSYLKLDNEYKREESVKDIGALIEWIAKQPELDASRIAVWGGSYGGYMVLASMVHYSDKLKCGIDVVGISNFVTFLQNTEDYRKDLRRVEYGDERDPKMKAFLLSISPANQVEKITKPLFIIQGLNDPRVPASESEQMKQNLRNNGKQVWYLLAKDEGHGFRKKNNIDYMQWAVVMFLQQHLIPR